jgi:hypothetical protein
MARNLPILMTSIIVVALFVLLIYPAVFPVNAPPVLKTFRDIFVAVVAVSILLICIDLSANWAIAPAVARISPRDTLWSILCTLRC